MKEKDLFLKLKEYYLADLQASKGTFSTYDCFSAQHNTFIELKCRNSHYENLMIEQSKYARLKYEAMERGMHPIYICSTPQGVWAFNLNLIEPEWKNQTDLPTTTEFDDKSRRTKSVGFLPISKGNRLTKIKGEK
jgi:predicted nucleic-acid-binding Zn-ribbon protein